jgi:hypothetical protein
LKTLGTTWVEQTPTIPNQELSVLPIADVRRAFLNELSYVCDYDKGGDTVTAIGVEETPQGYVFWVSANTCPEKKAVGFLRSILCTLKSIAADQSEDDTRMNDLAKECIRFAAPRIKKYLTLIRKYNRRCKPHLQGTQSVDGNFVF